MNKIILGSLLAIILISIVGISNEIFAAKSDIPQLFIEIPVINQAQNFEDQFNEPSNSIIINSKQIFVNSTVLDSDNFGITTFDDTLIITKDIQIEKKDYIAWYGTDEDGYSTNLMIFEDGSIYGMIRTADTTYKIVSDGIDPTHTFNEIDLSQLPPEHYGDEMELMDIANLPQDLQRDMELLGNSYIGGRDYRENTVTINLVVGYTSAVDDEFRDIERNIQNAVNEANRSYRNNGLPLELDLVDVDEVRGYTEEISDRANNVRGLSGLSKDLANLRDENMNDLDGLRGQGLRDDADVIILVTHYPSPLTAGLKGNGCGIAGDILVDNIIDSIAIVRDECLDGLSLTHEIGHLQGAGHDPEFLDYVDRFGNFVDEPDWTNPEFSFGHGYIDSIQRQRTIMAYDHEKCDPLNRGFECIRDDIWSDPNQNFRSSVTPAGTENINFNAKVLYATGEYISSLRGEPQSYDNINPRGQFDWGNRHNNVYNNDDILDISAVFDESIHDDFPPYVTVSDNVISTTSEMNKVSDTNYTYSHQLTSEIGDVTLSFSNARDLFGNEIVIDATSGGNIIVVAPIPTYSVTSISPTSGNTAKVGDNIIVTLTALEMGLTASGTQTINGVNSTFAESSSGIYTITYTVSEGDMDILDSVEIPVSITLKNSAGNVGTEITTIDVYTAPGIDANSPVISLVGGPSVNVAVGSFYVELGATASDDTSDSMNGDITDNILTKLRVNTSKVGAYTVTFDVTDSAGNSATQVTRTVNVVDYSPPSIILFGNMAYMMSVEVDSIFTDKYVAIDNVDGDITSSVMVTGSVDTSIIGTYHLYYNVTDSSGNYASESRTVFVVENIIPFFSGLILR